MSTCSRCGYAGTAAGPNCPRCGQPLAQPAPTRPTLILRLDWPSLPSREWEVTDTTMGIGRLDDSDIPVPDKSVSRQHARILPTPTGFDVEDLGSTNGTYVNDKPVTDRTRLSNGDRLTIGDVPLRVVLHSVQPAVISPPPLPPAPAPLPPARSAPPPPSAQSSGPSTVFYDIDDALSFSQPAEPPRPSHPVEVATALDITPAKPAGAPPPAPPPIIIDARPAAPVVEQPTLIAADPATPPPSAAPPTYEPRPAQAPGYEARPTTPTSEPRPASPRETQSAAPVFEPRPAPPAYEPKPWDPRPTPPPPPPPVYEPRAAPAEDARPAPPAYEPKPWDPRPAPPREAQPEPSYEPRPEPPGYEPKPWDPRPAPPREAQPEPSYEPEPRGPRPSYEPQSREPRPSYEPQSREPRPSYEPQSREPRPSYEPQSREPSPREPRPSYDARASAADLSARDLVDLADRLATALRVLKGDTRLALWLFDHAGGQQAAQAFVTQSAKADANPDDPIEQARLLGMAPTAARLLEAAVMLANVVSSLQSPDDEAQPDAANLEPVTRP